MFIDFPDLKVARKQNIFIDDRLCLEHLPILVILDAQFSTDWIWGTCLQIHDDHRVWASEGINPLRHLSPGARRAWRNHWSVHDECEEWRTSRLLAKPASLDVIIYDHLWHQGTTNDGDTFSLSKWYTAGQVWPGTVLLHQPGCLGHDTIFQLGHVMKPSLCSESNLPPICMHFVFPSPPWRELWPVDRDLIEASTPCPCSVTVKLHPPSFIPTFEQDPAPSRSRWNMACYYRHSKKNFFVVNPDELSQLTLGISKKSTRSHPLGDWRVPSINRWKTIRRRMCIGWSCWIPEVRKGMV